MYMQGVIFFFLFQTWTNALPAQLSVGLELSVLT